MRISDWSSDVCSSDLARPSAKGSSRPISSRFSGSSGAVWGADAKDSGRKPPPRAIASTRLTGAKPASAARSDIIVASARDHDLARRGHLADDLHHALLRIVDVGALDHRHLAHFVADRFRGALDRKSTRLNSSP